MKKPKVLHPSELEKIAEEWEDSKVVTDLLDHIAHLNNVIVEQASRLTEEEKT